MRLALYKETLAPTTKPKGVKRRLGRVIRLSLLASLMMAGGAAWWWKAPMMDRLIQLSAETGLKFENVVVFGRINTTNDELFKAIGMKRGDPIITADLKQIRDNIEALGWVEAARVERHFPKGLVIRLEERQALALYQSAEGHQVIDTNGKFIHGVKIEDFRHLPVISGTKAEDKARGIIAILETEADLYNEVWSLSYRSERRWDVYLGDNIRIMLPEEDPLSAWQKLAKMDRQHKLTQRNTVDIDLRIPGQIIIKPDQPIKPKGSQT